MAAYNLRYIYLAVFVCLNIVKAYFPDLVPEIGAEILLPLSGWGGTYYVSPLGSNTSPYDTWAKAANAISTITSLALTGANTIYVAPGTYTNTLALNNTKYDSLSIIGTLSGADPAVFPTGMTAATELVIWDHSDTSQNTIYCGTEGINNFALRNLSIKAKGTTGTTKTAVWHASTGNGWTFDSILFYADTDAITMGALLRLGGGTGHSVTRCRFRSNNSASGKYSMFVEGASAGTASDNIFEHGNGTNGIPYTTIYNNSSGVWNWYNNDIAGGYSNTFLHAGSGTSNLTNNVISGSIGGLASVARTAGTVNTTTNLIYSGTHTPANYYSGTVNSTGDLLATGYPQFRNMGRTRGYIVPTVDDNGGLSYVQALEPLLSSRGMKGTWGVYPYTLDAGDYAAVREIAAGGTVEIAVHGGYHTDLIYDHALNFSQSGGSNPTVAFDGTTITLSCDGTDYDNSYVVTDKTIDEIITALNGVKGWTVAKSTTDSQIATQINGSQPATVLATLTETAAPVNIDFDKTTADCTGGGCSAFYKTNVYDAKSYMADTVVNGAGNVTDPQTGATYVANTLLAPYNDLDTDSKTAIRTSGYTNSRCVAGAVYAVGNYTDLYGNYSVNCSDLIGATVAETKARARSVATNAALMGRMVYLLAHNDSQCSTTAENGWAAVLDAFAEAGNNVTVTSAQLAANVYRASPWTYTAGTGISTRTYTTYSDYRLRAGSPAINAGTDVGLTTDFLGKAIRGLPDIGAYEFYGATGNFGFGFGMGF